MVTAKSFFPIGLIAFIIILSACEDPGILKADQNFSRSSIRTVYIDTFAVITSTTLLDSLPTSGNNLILVGNYKDSYIGNVAAASYFQIAYQSQFAPDQNSTFDSIGLVLPYSHYSYGDTTQSQTISIHQMTSLAKGRLPLPYHPNQINSYFVASTQPTLYNASNVSFDPVPLTTATVKVYPHRDSLYISLPKSFGQNWFDIAQAEATSGIPVYFNDAGKFITDFFNGIHMNATSTGVGNVVGFKANKTKLRVYYKRYFGDLLQQTYFDFIVVNGAVQYNNINSDLSSTLLSSLQRRKTIPSSATGNATYVQSGVGLATKLEFPTVKSFFSNNNYILLDAVLEIIPVQNTYSKLVTAPATLALFTTDQTNVVLNRVPPVDGSSYLRANIFYDFEYGANVKYSFPLVNFLSSELATQFNTVTPLIIAAQPSALFNEVNRVVLGDRNNTQHKIKLKIHYSYAQN